MSVIEGLRELCTTCDREATRKVVDGKNLEARYFDSDQSIEARYGLLEQSQTIGSGCFSVIDGVLDGTKKEMYDFALAQVRSRANGGRSKFECAFDPTVMRMKRHKRIMTTELLYIDRKECMTNYIGSILQGDTQLAVMGNSDRLETVRRNTDLMVLLLLWDFHALALEVDGTNILGNWRPYELNSDTGALSYISRYPHYDGIVKQALLNDSGVYYHTVNVTLTTLAGGDGYFVEWNGDIFPAATPVDVATVIATFKDDVFGKTPYSATVDPDTPQVLTIIANDLEAFAYGDDAVKVYYSADNTWASCGDFLQGTVVQTAMEWHQKGLGFDWNEAITATNFHDYFFAKIQAIAEHETMLSNTGAAIGNGRLKVMIDPILFNYLAYDEINRINIADNAPEQTRRIRDIMPEFVPVQALKGTGGWVGSYSDNLIFATNTASPELNDTQIWYDQDCGHVKSRNEILGNAYVLDFAKVYHNFCDSPFHTSLKANPSPYQAENIPHLCQELRSDCTVGVSATYGTDTFRPYGTVSISDDGTNCTVSLDDTSTVPSGSNIASVVWTMHFYGTEAVPVAQSVNAVSNPIPSATCATLTMVEYQVTLDTGEVETVFIPATDFVTV